MFPDTRALGVALVVLIGVLAFVVWRRPNRLFAGGRRQLPPTLTLRPIDDATVPTDARHLLTFMQEKLAPYGFRVLEPVVEAPALSRAGARCLVSAFLHGDASALLLTGIEATPRGRSDLMIHILTPLTSGRVETSTLGALEQVAPPRGIDLHIVVDADSIEEIWSRHRRALMQHSRDARAPVDGTRWPELASEAYGAWIQAGIRAQRLARHPGTGRYSVRRPPRSVV